MYQAANSPMSCVRLFIDLKLDLWLEMACRLTGRPARRLSALTCSYVQLSVPVTV